MNRRRWRMPAALAAVGLVSVSTIAAPVAAADTGAGCSPLMAYLVPGTWETSKGASWSTPKGLLAPVGKKLSEDYTSSITVLYAGYEASAFDKGKTYEASEKDGVARLTAVMKRCPDSKIVLGGFSQGADVAGDLAWEIGHGKGPVPASSIAAVGLIADPKRGDSAVVGPAVDGQGITGGRPGGYGALSSKMFWLCGEDDKYCNVTSKNPFLAKLGETLGAPLTGDSPDLSSLTSNFGTADLAGAPSTADQLADSADGLSAPTSSGTGSQIAAVSTLAQQILNTFTPVLQTQQWMKTTPGAKSRLTGKADSPQGQTRNVLGLLDGMDVPGIIKTASSIVDTATQALGTTRPTPAVVEEAPTTTAPETTSTEAKSTEAESTEETPSVAPTSSVGESSPLRESTESTESTGAPSTTSETTPDLPDTDETATAGVVTDDSVATTTGEPDTPVIANVGDSVADPSSADLSGLASSALSLASQVAPLSDQDKGSLQTASQVMGTLRFDTIISQGMNVMAAVTSTDYAGIIRNLQVLPQQIVTGNIKGAHRTAGMLNNQFSPWVKMAAQMDYKMAGQIVTMIPDPSGYTQIAGLVLDLLGNVDIIRLARDVGQIQEVAWKVVETGNPLALGDLLPISLDLASVALGVLQPGQKMSPEMLGSGATTEQVQFAKSVQGQDFTSVVSGLTTLAKSDGAKNLAELVSEGLDAGSFLASNAHVTSYTKKPVYDGKTGVDYLYDRFRTALSG
ncbi:hypothetical protein GCM10023197_46100 [Gordonia humi]